jgi:Lrp/AsnC family leucine-responsive transcriptional regulator
MPVMSNKNLALDEYDHNIINILLEDAQTTNATIGHKIGLSTSAVNERVRKLKVSGVITKISAQILGSSLGMELGAFIYILVEGGESNNKLFLNNVIAHPNILECHHLTGDYSYLLKVKVANTTALEELISKYLKNQPGVNKTHTQIILASYKDSSFII